MFRLQGFAPSCRFTPPVAVRVYFTSVALMGFSPSGFFPLQEAAPPCRCAHYPRGVSSVRPPVAMAWTGRRRLCPAQLASQRGLLPPSGFQAPREFVRVGVRFYALPTADPLLGFCLLTVFPSFVGETDFAASPFSRFHASGSRSFPQVPNTPAPQRFTPQTRWLCLSRDRRTVSRFHACVQLAP
jgi:hypothetical protein